MSEFDQACSRFRDDSELSAVNAGAGAPVHVGPVLVEAVTVALRAARLTDGDLDPSQLTYALAGAARDGGTQIFTHTRVTGIDVAGGRVRGVQTD